MIICDYQLPSDKQKVAVFDDIRQLFEKDRVMARRERPTLLVWRNAFNSVEIKEQFREAIWPIRALECMPTSDRWPWRMKLKGESYGDVDQTIRSVELASGVTGHPSGNVHVTMELRNYDERESSVGGLSWWLSRHEELVRSNSFGRAFAEAIVRVLSLADQAGADLFTEQISIILTKDPSVPAATLTPRLHADKYYGERETAIASICEEGWQGLGGALFLPATNMQKLSNEGHITVERLIGELTSELLVRSNSGDVLIYDGMLTEDGAQDSRLGIPHISPEVPGQIARLCILMYHRKRADPLTETKCRN